MPRRKEVDAWLARYDNPMKDVVQRVREIVLGADPRIDECIKWQAPTFTYEGNLASFFPKSKKHASLMFHVGAKIPGKHPRLEGSGATSRVLKVASLAEAAAAKADIEAIVTAWCAWKSGDGAAVTRGKSAKTKTGKVVPEKAASSAKKKPRRVASKSAVKRNPRAAAKKPRAKRASRPSPR